MVLYRKLHLIIGVILFSIFHPNVSLAAQVCTINQAHSLIQIYVYNDSQFSSLGHNHVISTSRLTGELFFNSDDITKSSFSFSANVSDFEVNNAIVRNQAGPLFKSKVNKLYNKITRKSMLGDKGLDSQKYPSIRIESQELYRLDNNYYARMSLQLHGVKNSEISPFTVTQEVTELTNTMVIGGEFSISQQNYNMQPIKILFGLFGVKDELDIIFTLQASCH